MRAAYYVQQRDGQDSRWRTMAATNTLAAATRLAEELAGALGDPPYQWTLPVRVLSARELAGEVRRSLRAESRPEDRPNTSRVPARTDRA
jgi:hypothetical protein